MNREPVCKFTTKFHVQVFKVPILTLIMWSSFTGILNIGHALCWYMVQFSYPEHKFKDNGIGPEESKRFQSGWETSSKKDYGNYSAQKLKLKITYLSSNTFS